MKNVKTQILIMLSIGLVGFGIMFYELVKAVAKIVNHSGITAVFLSGRIQHGIGELMIFVTFFSLLLLGKIWTKARIFALADRLKFVMMGGGLLNGLALFNTISENSDWIYLFRFWCLFLLIFGQIAASVAKWMIGKEIDRQTSRKLREV